MLYYVYGVWESVWSNTSMVSLSLYGLIRLRCLRVCMFYYVYIIWESVGSMMSLVSASLYAILRLWCLGNRTYRLPDTIDII
jgi:hypothetical protein